MSLEQLYADLKSAISSVIVGQDEVVDLALACFLSSGHLLLEGPPGTAKTLLVRTLASALSMDFRRVQMTPDLLPFDITGSSIYREDKHAFQFERGPIFSNFLLADEINRASARTQAALLEAMQELTVTQGGESYALPNPFIVFATQNPIEQEGTYPLPLAQLDRFMFKVIVDFPDAEAEEKIYREHHGTGAGLSPEKFGVNAVISPEQVIAVRQTIRETFIREEVITYVQRLVAATRDTDDLTIGASTRAGLMLLMGAKSIARFAGRDYVMPDDIKEAFLPSMRHRVVLSPTAELEGATTDDVLGDLMEQIEVPR